MSKERVACALSLCRGLGALACAPWSEERLITVRFLLGIHHLFRETVPAVVAMPTVFRRLASKIARQIAHPTHGRLSIAHHPFQSISVVRMALLIGFQESMELLIVGKVPEFSQTPAPLDDSR